MKLKSTLFLLFSFAFFDLALISCGCDCNDGPEENVFICSLELSNLDNSGFSATVGGDTIVKEAFGIGLDVILDLNQTCSKQTPLLTGAYASDCSCLPATTFIRNRVTQLNIFTLDDFDAQHLAGSDVTSYFYEFFSGNYHPAADALDMSTAEFETRLIQRDLLLMEPPATAGNFSFEVQLVLSNGDTLSQTTQNVYLQ